jgi:hypothetical protein
MGTDTTQNLTALFLGDESTWDAVQFNVSSFHTLWGSGNVSITGRGTTGVGIVERGAQRQRRYAFTITRDEARERLRLLVAHDLLAIEPAERQSFIPDETMTTLALIKGRRLFSLQVWSADPPHPGIKAILTTMYALRERTAEMAPDFDGPVDL